MVSSIIYLSEFWPQNSIIQRSIKQIHLQSTILLKLPSLLFTFFSNYNFMKSVRTLIATANVVMIHIFSYTLMCHQKIPIQREQIKSEKQVRLISVQWPLLDHTANLT